MTAQGSAEAALLHDCLKELSKGLGGIWRPDLLDLLKGKLSPLRQAWGINTNSPDFACRTIAANIHSHMLQVTPRASEAGSEFIDEKDRERYWKAVAISFNVIDFPKPRTGEVAKSRTMKIGERRAWLQNSAPEDLRISISTCQRYFEDAIKQIAIQLTSETYKPVVPADAEHGKALLASTIQLAENTAPDSDEPSREAAQTSTLGANGLQLLLRKYKSIGIFVVTLVLTVAAIAVLLPKSYNELLPTGDNEEPQNAPPGYSLPPFTDRSNLTRGPLSSIPSVDTSGPPRQTQPDTREDGVLRATIIPSATNTNLSTAFPEQLAERAAYHATRLGNNIKTIDLQQAYIEQLNDGAYAVGGSALIKMELEGLADGEVTITDVRLDGLQRDPLPLGTVLLVDLGGGDQPRRLYYSLEQAVPVALHGPPYAEEAPRPFSEVERIGIPKNGKETLLLKFYTHTVAASFNIAVDYEYRGDLRTHVLHRTKDGLPFRMAAVACAQPEIDGVLIGTTPAELERIKRLEYGRVFQVDLGIGGQDQYSLKTRLPEDFASRCI